MSCIRFPDQGCINSAHYAKATNFYASSCGVARINFAHKKFLYQNFFHENFAKDRDTIIKQ